MKKELFLQLIFFSMRSIYLFLKGWLTLKNRDLYSKERIQPIPCTFGALFGNN